MSRPTLTVTLRVPAAVFLLALLLRMLWLALMYTQQDDANLLYLAPDCGRYVQMGTYFAGLPYEGPPLDWHSGPIYATPEGSILWSGPGYGLFLAGPPRSFMLSGWGFNSNFDDPGSCIKTDARHYVSWYMIADKEEHIAPNYRWMDESVAMLMPLSKGHYINEIDPVRYPHHVQECFSETSWKRLAELRKKYDPDSVFHTYLGQNEQINRIQ